MVTEISVAITVTLLMDSTKSELGWGGGFPGVAVAGQNAHPDPSPPVWMGSTPLHDRCTISNKHIQYVTNHGVPRVKIWQKIL